jgi:hypothetical protein
MWANENTFVKVSRRQSIPLNQNKFKNNSEGKIHRHLHYTISRHL